MKTNSGFALGLKGGIIIGIVYAILLWIKYTFLGHHPFGFWASGFVSYAIIIACMVVLGMHRKHNLGGFAEIKDIFQPLFIAIILIELAYLLFTFYYLNYLNPDFFEGYKKALAGFGESRNVDAKKVAEQISLIAEQQKSSHDFWLMFKGIFLRWVIVDSVFAMMIAFFLRKKKPENY